MQLRGTKQNKKWRSLPDRAVTHQKRKLRCPNSKTLSAVNHVILIIYLKNGFSIFSESHLQVMHELPWAKVLSSTKFNKSVFDTQRYKSLINMLNKSGPSIEP